MAKKVKEFIAGPIIDGAELVLPDSIDHKIEAVRGKVITKLDRVIALLQLNQACLALPTFQERFVCFANTVKNFEPMVQNALIAKQLLLTRRYQLKVKQLSKKLQLILLFKQSFLKERLI